jgi:hypothetical protein
MLTGSEIVAFREGASLVATAVQVLVRVYRQNQTVSRTKVELLRIDADKAILVAWSHARGEIARANIEEIAATARLIGTLQPSSPALPYAMDQLELLSSSLRRQLDDF